MSRLFSPEELEVLATPLSIRLERAAETRDEAAVREISVEMERECTAIYDKQCVWTATMQTFLIEEVGEEGHDEALRSAGAVAFRPAIEAYRGLDSREHIARVAQQLRASGSTFWATEEDGCVRFRLDPGGSARMVRSLTTSVRRIGSRLVYRGQGATGLALIADGTPCFDAVEHLFFEALPIEQLGSKLAALKLPHGVDGPAYLDVPVTDHGVLSQDELELLATPLSLRVEALGNAHDWDGLRTIAATMDQELVVAKDPLNLLNAGLLSWIARRLGEGAVEQALRRSAAAVMGPTLDAIPKLPFADALRQFVMVWRAHGSTFWIEETDDTVVIRGRPLGACGRLWAHAAPPERVSASRVRYETWGAYDAPEPLHVMREPRGITCGTTAMPIYSCHCHMFHEIFPIERIGRPLWIEEHPVDDRDGETVHVYYKDGAMWPEEYYARVGLRRATLEIVP